MRFTRKSSDRENGASKLYATDVRVYIYTDIRAMGKN